MALPKFVGAASIYISGASYRTADVRSETVNGSVAIAQHDPCARSGGGGVILPPTPCPRGRKCCGNVVNNKCIGQCVPNDAACP